MKQTKMTQKGKLAARFEKNFKDQGLRLLAIQLNGFSHKVFFDKGTKNSKVQVAEFSGYASEAERNGYRNREIAAIMLSDIAHAPYQGNPCEIVYVKPNER